MNLASLRFLLPSTLCVLLAHTAPAFCTPPSGIRAPHSAHKQEQSKQRLLPAHAAPARPLLPALTTQELETLWNITSNQTFVYNDAHYRVIKPPVVSVLHKNDALNPHWQSASDDIISACNQADLGKRALVGQALQETDTTKKDAIIGIVVARMARQTLGIMPSSNGCCNSFYCHRAMTQKELKTALPSTKKRWRWWCCL